MTSPRSALLLTFVAAPLALLARQGAGQRRVSYVRDVDPIFQARCVSCHGTKSPSEGLDLSSLAGVRRGSAGGAMIVPGDPDRSRLFTMILPHDGKVSMPPGRPLTQPQIDTIREWIRQGALDDATERPWFESVPTRPVVPSVKRTGWARNPIDAFVLQRLEERGLGPSPEADRKALQMRVTLALTEGWPTAQQVAGFVADRRPDAYDRLVDGLLLRQKIDQASLERWRASESDPLKRRVEVNRAWARLFVRGLVEPVGEFRPASKTLHPELLDWLTTESIRLKWELKALYRAIVTSATYRQSSKVTKSDPKNELLSRGPGL
ncbi:DUF1553 domain-containing protein [bacterium]|nr:MAG: DUF1553 domain-containing protein [bacterium]